MTAAINPLLSDNKLKLGAFSLNGDTNRRTLHSHHYRFNWENSLDVAEQADAAGFEAVVPFARWRSLAGPTHFGGSVFEATTWASAVAARTSRCGIMSTIHVTTMHPTLAAKVMTTVDHVSKGRFALNIVCGWFEAEMKMFGQPLLPHEERYAYAEEWISAIKLLWTSEEPFDFHGKYIRIEQGVSLPKPVQRPHPVLMNAARSSDGKAFVARHCDIALIGAGSHEAMKAEVEAYRSEALRTTGRQLQIWTPCAIIQGDTIAQARALADEYAAQADPVQIEMAFRPGSPYAGDLNSSPAEIAERKRIFAISASAHLLMGDAEHIAQEMRRVSDTGIDGLLINWIEPQSGIRQFTEKVLPLLVQDGLRNG